MKNLYESFVSARDREERGLTEKTKNSDRPRTGNTVHVFGYNITEDIIRLEYIRERHSLVAQTRLMIALVCRGAFMPPPGCKIINVSMEVEKNTGFVTFDKPEAAEAAINQHNGQFLNLTLHSVPGISSSDIRSFWMKGLSKAERNGLLTTSLV